MNEVTSAMKVYQLVMRVSRKRWKPHELHERIQLLKQREPEQHWRISYDNGGVEYPWYRIVKTHKLIMYIPRHEHEEPVVTARVTYSDIQISDAEVLQQLQALLGEE